MLTEKRHSQGADARYQGVTRASVSKYISDWLVAKELWLRKQTSSSGCALGLGLFTAIIPCQPVNNYYKRI